MGGSLEAFKLFAEAEKRRADRYDQMTKAKASETSETASENTAPATATSEPTKKTSTISSQNVPQGTGLTG